MAAWHWDMWDWMMKEHIHAQPPTPQAETKLEFSFLCKVGFSIRLLGLNKELIRFQWSKVKVMVASYESRTTENWKCTGWQRHSTTGTVQYSTVRYSTICTVQLVDFWNVDLHSTSTQWLFVLSVPPVVEVLEPPFNSPLQERVANQRIAFPCPARGKVILFFYMMKKKKCLYPM